jgi:hypothetical protein
MIEFKATQTGSELGGSGDTSVPGYLGSRFCIWIPSTTRNGSFSPFHLVAMLYRDTERLLVNADHQLDLCQIFLLLKLFDIN